MKTVSADRLTDPRTGLPYYLARVEMEAAALFAQQRLHAGGGVEAIGGAAGQNDRVHALDQALRRALAPRHPELTNVGLVDFKVRILDGRAGTRAVTRVLVTSADPDAEWTTVGVSDDIVTASWEALADGIHYGLLRAKQPARIA